MFHSTRHSKSHQEMLNLLCLLRQGKLQLRHRPQAQEKELGQSITYNMYFFMNKKIQERSYF